MISAEWVSRSVSPHAQAREDTGYGYLWWLPTYRANGREYKCFALFGTGGNKVYVFPVGGRGYDNQLPREWRGRDYR